MRLTDARALDPKLLAEPADPAGDAALLKRLARWAGRWSPLVEVDGEDGLRLDVSGVAHLFGGEEALVADMEAQLRRARPDRPHRDRPDGGGGVGAGAASALRGRASRREGCCRPPSRPSPSPRCGSMRGRCRSSNGSG